MGYLYIFYIFIHQAGSNTNNQTIVPYNRGHLTKHLIITNCCKIGKKTFTAEIYRKINVTYLIHVALHTQEC